MKLLRFVDELMQRSFAIQRRHRTEPHDLRVAIMNEATNELIEIDGFDYDRFEADGPTYLLLQINKPSKRRGTFTRE